jgi:hypothetical protein
MEERMVESKQQLLDFKISTKMPEPLKLPSPVTTCAEVFSKPVTVTPPGQKVGEVQGSSNFNSISDQFQSFTDQLKRVGKTKPKKMKQQRDFWKDEKDLLS